MDEVVFRTLEKDREKRFQSAGEVKTQVEHLTEVGLGPNPEIAASNGPVEGQGASASSPAEKPEYAFRAFAGAALVSISLAKPMNIVVSLLAGRGGVTASDLWLALGSVALPGLGGTLVGWLALKEIRDSHGAVRGLPFAMFATLTWPLLTVLAITLGPPMFLLVPGGGSGWMYFLGRLLVLLLPADLFTWALWVVYATARWATNRPTTGQPNLLKWVFTGLLVCAYGFALVTR